MKGHALSNRYVRPLIQADLRYLLTAFPVRETDRIEVEEACGLPFQVALKATLSSSDNPHVIEVDGSVEGVFGVSDHSDGVGVPWLIASDALFEKYARTFAKHSKLVTSRLFKPYDLLFNFVLKDNEASIKWLRFLGFQFFEKDWHFRPGGPPFLLFYKVGGEDVS